MPKHLSYTIYGKVGSNTYPKGNVGISIKPTPNLTSDELKELIDELGEIYHQMQHSEENV